MKTSFLNLSILCLLIIFVSCEDATDIRQTNEIPEEGAISDLSSMRLATRGAYSALAPESEIRFVSTFTDELSIGVENGGQGITNDALYTYTLNPTTGDAAGIWNANYALIQRVNRIIEAADDIENNEEILVDQADLDEFNYYLATVYSLRAYAYVKLLSYYSPDMTNDSSLGVILVDFVPETPDPANPITLPRSTVGEIATLIESDFSIAQSRFDDIEDFEANIVENPLIVLNENNDRLFIDNDFLNALRSRYFLYRGQHDLAVPFALGLVGAYPLSGRDEYFFMWEDFPATEIIFKADRTINSASLNSYFNSQASSATGAPIFEMGRAVFNNLLESDVRFDRWIDGTSTIDENYQLSPDPRNTDILVIDKYPGNDQFNLVNDIMIFRGSEQILILVESALALDNLSQAQTFMQLLKNARSNNGTAPPVNYANVQEAWLDVLNERRLELWLEGHRYIDVKRLASLAGVSGFEKDPIDCIVANTTSNCDLSIQDDAFKFTLPIPLSESNGNPQVQQNDNY